MAASSSSSCKSLTSSYAKPNEVYNSDPAQSDADLCLCRCDAFRLTAPQHMVPSGSCQFCNGGIAPTECRTTASLRKIHKADREKLRRDRLNEQLLELAAALEPDRPKNDKSTILGDAIHTLRDLMAEVERLRAEHALLEDESQDLFQEKKELQDEKLQFRSKVQRLQCQVQQHMHAMLLWVTADPTGMISANGPFQFPGTSFSQRAADGDAATPPPTAPSLPPQAQHPPPPLPNPYLSMPFLPGSVAVHPMLRNPYAYGGRGAPYYPNTLTFSNSLGLPEEASGQIPMVLQSMSAYPPLMHPMPTFSHSTTYPQAYGPGFSFLHPPNAGGAFAPEQTDAARPSNPNPSLHVPIPLHRQIPTSLSDAQILHSQQDGAKKDDRKSSRVQHRSS